ncbi:E-selectin-like isoform X1 [Ambystoma mexicanum]|uniref:E-selectin-like isoform X1 n=1 Tax=Ambystoma mexicanum TaxID=8296 RepID=UPI0037E74B90
MIGLWILSIISYGLVMFSQVDSWTYHYSNATMNYTQARQWCRAHYTDMVAIQNREENEHLNEILPFTPTYYWIGIRKIRNQWTWVGTNKALTEEAKNWADNEPNNKKNNEDCVEIYIKRRRDPSKWNDESCRKKKVALCYTASCHAASCSGNGECVETIDNHTCQCYEGFYGSECQHVMPCEPLEAPRNGFLNCNHPVQEFSYNSSCQISCVEGYALNSLDTVQCTSSGRWTTAMPECQVMKCNVLEDPAQGVMNCSHPLGDFMVNSTCNFACNKGFVMTGSDRLQCGASGEWDGNQPECEAVQCDQVTMVEHGTVTCSGSYGKYSYNATCDFTCDEGYAMSGSAGLRCAAEGEWTHEVPKCEAVKCPDVKMIEHGIVACSVSNGEFSYNANCEFTCDEGYRLTGATSLQCTVQGEWTAQVPKCEAIKCEEVKTVEHGIVSCSGSGGVFSYASTCDVTCHEGYTLTGPASLQCTAQGVWTEDVPKCEAVKCEPLSAPGYGAMSCAELDQDGRRNLTCHFSCDEGFVLAGSQRLHCTAAGHWTEEAPRCEAVTCATIQKPEHGNMDCMHARGMFAYKSSCSFRCNEGFSLIGTPLLRCSSEGLWTAQAPTCQAVQCEALPVPDKGLVNCSHPFGDFRYAAECKYECTKGHTLMGSDTLECSATGLWTASPPTCEAVDESDVYVAVGVAATGTSLLSAGSLLVWLVKRLRKTGKKFRPSSSCQSLDDSSGVYQSIVEQI